GRCGGGSGRRDRKGQTENAGIRHRRRDRVESRALLRRHHPRLCREGGVAGLRLDLLSALNAERAARREVVLVTDIERDVQRLVRATEVATDPLKELLEKHLRSGKSG